MWVAPSHGWGPGPETREKKRKPLNASSPLILLLDWMQCDQLLHTSASKLFPPQWAVPPNSEPQ
ncbi:hypothetical protein I79_002024 [Cricetulus griseus]|uniref:Uncharacterized protein n=1 Tax=Cricetulus griseus TaxID=10029 RepID=G3GWA4_CRIGR|nr:hypothetical protein I79_002024 [Cricetulus griseus]